MGDFMDSMETWYKDKCGEDAHLSSVESDSASDVSSEKYIQWQPQDHEFITEVCITYRINSLIENYHRCGHVSKIFLELCENNRTDFNSSNLIEHDLDNLTVSIIPDELIASGSKNTNDNLGILIDFPMDSNIFEFELCLGNVSVDSTFNQEKETIDIGHGSMEIVHGNEVPDDCPADGLPCLNFFFDIPCPNDESGSGSDSDSNSQEDDDDESSGRYNAFTGEKKKNMDTLQIFEDLNIFVQITIVSLLTGFVCFLMIVSYIELSRRLNEYKMRKLNVREVEYYFGDDDGMHMRHHVQPKNDCSDLEDDVEYTVEMMMETR